MSTVEFIKVVIVALLGYLLGSLNSSLIVGKIYGVDVRKHGSGNAGATNTLRTLGKSAALLTTLGDLLKGFIACLLGFYVMTDNGFTIDIYNRTSLEDIGLMIGGLGAIFGHNWPIYFGFKGGKGVLATFVVVLMMDWRIALFLLGVFIVIVFISRYISLGSILCAASVPLVGLIVKQSDEFIIFSVVLAILVVFRHRSNIQRIAKGNESKFSMKKKAADADKISEV